MRTEPGNASHSKRSERPRLQEKKIKMKRVDLGMENSSIGDELSCLQPKQLSFHASTFPSRGFTDDARASLTIQLKMTSKDVAR